LTEYRIVAAPRVDLDIVGMYQSYSLFCTRAGIRQSGSGDVVSVWRCASTCCKSDGPMLQHGLQGSGDFLAERYALFCRAS
jgi:hypothetical protein